MKSTSSTFTSFIVLTILFSLWSPLLAQEETQKRKNLEDEIKAVALPYIDSDSLVGVSIGVIRDGEMAQVHLGVARQGGAAPDSDTIYEVGSVSKVFTGILLADAVNRGELELNQAAQELLPADIRMPKGNREITLLDLATHRSGLPRIANNMNWNHTLDPYSEYTSQLAFEFLNEYKLKHEPGERQAYSNLGMSLLGVLICKNANKTFDELLADRIADPLEMSDTRVELSESMTGRMATPCNALGEETHLWNFADMPGAGGIRSSTSDMLRLVEACLNTSDTELSKAIAFSMQEHDAGGNGSPRLGLSWHFGREDGVRWHNGQTGGFHSMLVIDLERKTGVIVLSNTTTPKVDELAMKINNLLHRK